MRYGLLLGLAVAGTAFAGMPPQATPTPPAASAPIPVEVFAAPPAIETPKLSPDGTLVVSKHVIGGKQTLVVTPLFGGGAPRSLGAGDDLDINWWRWVNDGWLVIGVGTQMKLYGIDVYVTRVIGLSADMKTVNRIAWDKSGLRADDVLWTAKDGTPRILLSRQTGIDAEDDWNPSVFEVDVSTGKSRRVASGIPNVRDWYADGNGQVRAAYRYDDAVRKSALLYRANNAESFRVIARKTRKDSDGLTIPLTFRTDGTAIAFDDADGYTAVYQVSLPDLAPVKKLYSLDGYDVDSIFDNAAENDIAGVAVTDRYSRAVWFDETLKTLQGHVDKAVGSRRARIVSWNQARTRFLIEVGSPSQAGALYYWDSAGDRMQRIAWNSSSLQARVLSPVTTIRYAARDGTSIESVLTMPRHRVGQKNLPLIVMPHGGPAARDSEGWDWWSQYLAELGYVVIQPNYRGSSGYGEVFSRKGAGEWGLKMQDDLNDAVTHLAKEGIADPKRVCMVGASYGGYAAMRAAQRDGALYRCAVSYAGVSDLETLRKYDGQFLNGRAIGDWLRQQAPDFKAISPRFGAASFSTPILLLHGKLDKRVPVNQSRMLASELRRAGKPHQYIEQPLGDHFFSRGEDRLQFLKAMADFLKVHNPA
ncbi:alpha/beta hydrolase family protein [Sphingomonas sp. CFBP 13720]|uniref:alpha/beta hydrolase family protein n=1 Tax=Sphingomonas sp. CFBP 13720 TaxID=2775302 RepID=UPI001786B267|nr:S9 family peptidase [Sphingomonas sp. CFBP 13720]MBD8678040.1 S9 family peptidase [Sphingomonas sp. CFBP 13720]